MTRKSKAIEPTAIVRTDAIDMTARLGELERVIERNLAGFLRTGLALAEIREQRLYRDGYSSFDAYCRDRWGFSRTYATRLIQAAGAVEEMVPMGTTGGDSINERQARVLAKLDDPVDRWELWRQAVREANGGRVTAQLLEELFERRHQALRALTSSASVEWYTPPDIIEAARQVMGGIDLDPASSAEANEVVRANRFYTIVEDGLRHPWVGRVWLNPPYGRDVEHESNQAIWSSRLIDELRAGRTMQATTLVNSATANRWFQPLWDFPLCFIRGRIEFLQPSSAPKKKQPTQSSAIAYLGPEIEKFVRTFSEYGRCVVPHESYSVGCAA